LGIRGLETGRIHGKKQINRDCSEKTYKYSKKQRKMMEF
jgi:hypothetical protein